MSTKSPTPAQFAALRAIAAGMVTMFNAGYSAFRIDGAQPQVVGRVVALGWARWPKGAVGEQTCELTDAGLAWLPTPTFAVGDRVAGGKPLTEDYGIGTISEPNEEDLRIPHRATDMWVAWDNGVLTWTAALGLRPL